MLWENQTSFYNSDAVYAYQEHCPWRCTRPEWSVDSVGAFADAATPFAASTSPMTSARFCLRACTCRSRSGPGSSPQLEPLVSVSGSSGPLGLALRRGLTRKGAGSPAAKHHLRIPPRDQADVTLRESLLDSLLFLFLLPWSAFLQLVTSFSWAWEDVLLRKSLACPPSRSPSGELYGEDQQRTKLWSPEGESNNVSAEGQVSAKRRYLQPEASLT